MNPEADHSNNESTATPGRNAPILAVGEILWDLLENGRHLGGAPLNFSAHATSLGHSVKLLSALGADELGAEAAERITALDLDGRYLQISNRFATGTAAVTVAADGSPGFTITRPAAYDDVELSLGLLLEISQIRPAWFYFGSLFAATKSGRTALGQLLEVLGESLKFLDLNLRPGFDSPDLVLELLRLADAVKLNESELERVCELTGLPPAAEPFCRAAAEHFGWQATAITLGDQGAAILLDGSYAHAPALPVTVINTLGTGDAFAAAFVHGLSQDWPAGRIVEFANRRAATVAGQPGALP